MAVHRTDEPCLKEKNEDYDAIFYFIDTIQLLDPTWATNIS